MTNSPTRLVILGPQGVGKGTQAARLATALHIEHLSTGTLLRHVACEPSRLGAIIETYLGRGDLVPDGLVLAVVQTEISLLEEQGHGYILDGFPRTIGQAIDLTNLVGSPVAAAIELTLPLGALLRRLNRRRVCPSCGATSEALADYIEAIACKNGDGIAVRRSDDNPTTVAHRLALYDRHTKPLVEWFRDTSEVITISGEGTPEEVHIQILDAVSAALDTERASLRRLDLAQRARLDRTVMVHSAGYRSAVALGGPQ
jgi:adenylate kinase